MTQRRIGSTEEARDCASAAKRMDCAEMNSRLCGRVVSGGVTGGHHTCSGAVTGRHDTGDLTAFWHN